MRAIEPLPNLLDLPKIPLGRWAEQTVDWLRSTFEVVFDGVNEGLQWGVVSLAELLFYLPPLVMVVLFAGLAVWLRGWLFGVFTAVGLTVIVSMGLWEAATQTLALVLVASLIALLIAVPVGILAAENPTVSRTLRPVLDLMQTMPAFVYLIPAVVFFSLGETPGVLATVVFAMPPGIRLTELGIRQVDQEMVEAGEAFGTTPRRILTGIKIPLALPTIMAGVNQVIMLGLSMVVIAGMVGAPGLGSVVTGAVATVDIGRGFEGGLAVVILAIYLDRVTASLGRRAPVAKARQAVNAA